jgi:hypothetical protein
MEFEQVGSSRREEQRVDVLIRITGAEPRPYAFGKILWRPTRISGGWSRYRTDGEWSEWSWSGRVRGPKLKKDGSPSNAAEVADLFLLYERRNGGERAEFAEAAEATRPGDGLPESFDRS